MDNFPTPIVKTWSALLHVVKSFVRSSGVSHFNLRSFHPPKIFRNNIWNSDLVVITIQDRLNFKKYILITRFEQFRKNVTKHSSKYFFSDAQFFFLGNSLKIIKITIEINLILEKLIIWPLYFVKFGEKNRPNTGP